MTLSLPLQRREVTILILCSATASVASCYYYYRYCFCCSYKDHHHPNRRIPIEHYDTTEEVHSQEQRQEKQQQQRQQQQKRIRQRKRQQLQDSFDEKNEKGEGDSEDNSLSKICTTSLSSSSEENDDNEGDEVISNKQQNSSSLLDIESRMTALLQARRVIENRKQIDRVIQYWFVRYGTADQSQKKLWMIPQQSEQYRRQVDLDITKQFGGLLLELSSSSSLATDTKEHETHDANSCRWKEWCGMIGPLQLDQNQSNFEVAPLTASTTLDWHSLYGFTGKLAAIIVLDQMSRHIHRFKQDIQQLQPQVENVGRDNKVDNYDDYNHLFSLLPDQSTLDDLALQASQLLLKHHSNEVQSGMTIPVPQFIFAIMPFRHASTLDSVRIVQEHIEGTMNTIQLQQHNEMLKRFRKATNRRMADLQDEARRGHHATTQAEASTAKQDSHPLTTQHLSSAINAGPDSATNPNVATTSSTLVEETNDNNSVNIPSFASLYTDDDILESFPFESDMKISENHIVHKTIQIFLEKQGIYPLSTNEKSPCGSDMIENGSETRIPVIVSLSGGVDSMVIARVLAHLRDNCGFHHLDLVATHIDYGNRSESYAEAEYVRRYCERYGIIYYCRRIYEVTRGVTARDEYEKISRDIRYNLYREAIQKCCKKKNNAVDGMVAHQGRDVVIGVMIGHHRGDLRENVLSNAHKGFGPLDLSGMTSVSKNNGVTLFRPLLPLEKSSIFEYAHTFGVPYFKDSTPHWSTRGKLRNKLLPLLEEIYGQGSMNNLSNLAVESDDCKQLIYDALIRSFMDNISYDPLGISFATIEYANKCLYFWKFVLREALHSAKLGMFTDKSVESFVHRIQTNPLREGWLQSRKDYSVYLRRDGRVFVLYPYSFPWNKADYYDTSGIVLPFGAKSEMYVQVGPWIVSAHVILDDCLSNQNVERCMELLNQKAVPTMEDFMKGYLEYYIKVPTWQRHEINEDIPDTLLMTENQTWYARPLIFTKFKKQTRPFAWKGVDVKIQETIPLLGNDEIAEDALKNPMTYVNVEGIQCYNPVLLVQVKLRLTSTLPQTNEQHDLIVV